MKIIFSEVDPHSEEVSGRVAFGMSFPRESGHILSPTGGKTSAQIFSMDVRFMWQVILHRESPGRTFR